MPQTFKEFKRMKINKFGVRTKSAFQSLIQSNCMEHELNELLENLFSITLRHQAKYIVGPNKIGDARTLGETAFQRGIYKQQEIQMPGHKTVKWLDIEVPVEYYSAPRRGGVDLFGYCDEDKSTYVVELKYAGDEKHPGDTPLFAALELAHYAHALWDKANKAHLLERVKPSMFHANSAIRSDETYYEQVIDCGLFQRIVLVIAANSMYWNCWIGNEQVASRVDAMRSVVQAYLKHKTNKTVTDLLFLDTGTAELRLEGLQRRWDAIRTR